MSLCDIYENHFHRFNYYTNIFYFFFIFRVADIALIGLAVMGQNLILNMNDHGFVVCAYNRTTDKVKSFLENEAKNTKVIGAYSLKEMVSTLKSPRRVMLLVKGKVIFFLIELL